MTSVRAVFRVLSILERLDAYEVNLKPMNRESGEAFPENVPFWKYTPGGELVLTMPKNARPGVAVGAFLYVDLAPAKDGAWMFHRVSRSVWEGSGDGEGTVEFRAQQGHRLDAVGEIQWGTLRMDLSGRAATIQGFGAVGTTWALQLMLVEPAATK